MVFEILKATLSLQSTRNVVGSDDGDACVGSTINNGSVNYRSKELRDIKERKDDVVVDDEPIEEGEEEETVPSLVRCTSSVSEDSFESSELSLESLVEFINSNNKDNLNGDHGAKKVPLSLSPKRSSSCPPRSIFGSSWSSSPQAKKISISGSAKDGGEDEGVSNFHEDVSYCNEGVNYFNEDVNEDVSHPNGSINVNFVSGASVPPPPPPPMDGFNSSPSPPRTRRQILPSPPASPALPTPTSPTTVMPIMPVVEAAEVRNIVETPSTIHTAAPPAPMAPIIPIMAPPPSSLMMSSGSLPRLSGWNGWNGGRRPWSSTSALLKKPSRSCLRKSRYSFSGTTASMSDARSDARRGANEAKDVPLPPSLRTLLPACKSPSLKNSNEMHEFLRCASDIDADAVLSVVGAERRGKQERREVDQVVGGGVGLPDSASSRVSFHSQVSVFEFAVPIPQREVQGDDGWCKYFV